MAKRINQNLKMLYFMKIFMRYVRAVSGLMQGMPKFLIRLRAASKILARSECLRCVIDIQVYHEPHSDFKHSLFNIPERHASPCRNCRGMTSNAGIHASAIEPTFSKLWIYLCENMV